jgi:hypothetical protein
MPHRIPRGFSHQIPIIQNPSYYPLGNNKVRNPFRFNGKYSPANDAIPYENSPGRYKIFNGIDFNHSYKEEGQAGYEIIVKTPSTSPLFSLSGILCLWENLYRERG